VICLGSKLPTTPAAAVKQQHQQQKQLQHLQTASKTAETSIAATTKIAKNLSVNFFTTYFLYRFDTFGKCW